MKKIEARFDLLKDSAIMRWERLSHRDQQIIICASTLFALFLIYFLIILPLSQWKHREEFRLAEASEELVFTKKNLPLAQYASERQKQLASAGNIPSVISNTARMSGISFLKAQPLQNAMALWIDDVSYQRLTAWLVYLTNNTALKVNQIRLEKTDERSGMVKAFLKLSK